MAGRKATTNTTAAKREAAPIRYSKAQICASEKYRNQSDLVYALLDEKKKYTMETVDTLIDGFKKGMVK